MSSSFFDYIGADLTLDAVGARLSLVESLATTYADDKPASLDDVLEQARQALSTDQEADRHVDQLEKACIMASTLVQALGKYKEEHRDRRIGYMTCPGGILNAYREGDLTFDEAVALLEVKKTTPVATLALEFGYRAHEKGQSLDMAIEQLVKGGL